MRLSQDCISSPFLDPNTHLFTQNFYMPKRYNSQKAREREAAKRG
jgi:hypothetical protein